MGQWRYYVVWIAYDGQGHCLLQREEVLRRSRIASMAAIERLEEDLRVAFGPADHTHTVLNFILLGQD